MSKRILLLSSLFGACASGQILHTPCFEEKKALSKNVRSLHKATVKLPNPSLNFTLDPKRQVINYLPVGMTFNKKPKQFEGKDLLKVIALSKTDRRTLKKAFRHAAFTTEPQIVSYAFKGQECVAHIKPLLKGKGESAGFFVEVVPKNSTLKIA
jgi:hypothetical protein